MIDLGAFGPRKELPPEGTTRPTLENDNLDSTHEDATQIGATPNCRLNMVANAPGLL